MSAQREATREAEAQIAEVRRLTATLRLQAHQAEAKAAQALRVLRGKRVTEPAAHDADSTHTEAPPHHSQHTTATLSTTPGEHADAGRHMDTENEDDGVPTCFHQHAAWSTELLNGSTPVAKYTVTDEGEGIHYHTLYTIPPEHEADTLEKLRRLLPENRLNTKNTPRGLCIKILPHGKEAGNEYKEDASNRTATTRVAETTPAQSTTTTTPGENTQTPPTNTNTDTRSLLLQLRWWGITTWIHTKAEREQEDEWREKENI